MAACGYSVADLMSAAICQLSTSHCICMVPRPPYSRFRAAFEYVAPGGSLIFLVSSRRGARMPAAPSLECPPDSHVLPDSLVRRSRRMHARAAAQLIVAIAAVCSGVFAGRVEATSLSSGDGSPRQLIGDAVVIDAGSTGTRLYVYRYTYGPPGGGEPQLDRDLQVELPAVATKRISPGIAAFAEQVYEDARSGRKAEEPAKVEGDARKAAQSESAVSGEQFHSDALPAKTFALYMQRLKQAAVAGLPDAEAQREALVVFRGTAGMRALPEEQREALLSAVCSHIKQWGMRYLEGKSCGVLVGQEEGVLGWLALNQLLGRMPPEISMVNFRNKQMFQEGGSGAMIEMGGASAQVVFELPLSVLKAKGFPSSLLSPPPAEAGSLLLPVEGHADLKLLRIRGKSILLFTKSYMGLGRQLALVRVAARSLREHYESYASHLEEKFPPSPPAVSTPSGLSMLPSSPLYEAPLSCFPLDVTLSVDLAGSHFVMDEFLHDDLEGTPLVRGGGVPQQEGRGQQCGSSGSSEAEPVRGSRSWESLTTQMEPQAVRQLAKEEADRLRAKRFTRARGIASFEGCQRDIAASWEDHEKLPFDLPADMQLYGTENFFHFNEYVVQAEERPTFSISSFRRSAEALCALPKVKDVVSRIHPSAAAEKAQTGCFGLVLMSQFLEDVLRLDKDRELLAVNEVNGIEVSWTAGILFVLLPEVLAGERSPRPPGAVAHDEL
ncbi:hypothetical protein Efla_001687 [Eimeria flavescens]